jgi:hypothetical protein
MKTNSTQLRWAGRLVAVTMAGTLMAAPLLAQAAPPSHAPAWGHRNQNDKKYDKNRAGQRWDNNSNRPGNTYNRPGNNTYRPGTGYNRPGNGYNRPGNGYNRPGTNNRRGNNTYRPGTTYQPGGYDSNVRQNFGGVVTGNVSGNQFTMRSDSGRTITVRVQQSGQMDRLSRGDRVQVAGYCQSSNLFDAQDLNFVQDR